MITVRVLDLQDDALIIIEGARDCVRRHREHQGDLNLGSLFPASDKLMLEAVDRMVNLPGMEVLAAESNGYIVGGIGVLYSQYMWNPGLLVADHIFWWTRETAPFRTAKVLIDQSLKRCEMRSAIPIMRAIKTGTEGVEKLYKRLGMVEIEKTYMRLP